jgi:hypothetical protein
MKRLAFAAVAISMLLCAESRADIYRWEDDTGAVNFTDDISNVPPAFRDKATMVIREAPAAAQPPPSAPSKKGDGTNKVSPPSEPPPAQEASEPADQRDEIASRVAQLKAKIAAKEKLIQFVDDRRNLALNPLRSRVVDPGDLELYRKYQAELPEDRRELQELESLLESLN